MEAARSIRRSVGIVRRRQSGFCKVVEKMEVVFKQTARERMQKFSADLEQRAKRKQVRSSHVISDVHLQ